MISESPVAQVKLSNIGTAAKLELQDSYSGPFLPNDFSDKFLVKSLFFFIENVLKVIQINS